MQKLIWKNGNGKEIELTQEPYGITEWEGFSNTELNVQTQQVPFNDGAVFIDALLEQRSLSVTLAMNDKNNLEDRYRLRRELIASMNPKLGEGYLIYENDFLKKQIKCLPYIPSFENHNSNTKGTPKAQLTWTACEPYWEDIEEEQVFISQGEVVEIENKGDVPCAIVAEIYPSNSENTSILNQTTGKKIQLKNTLTGETEINTNNGKKTIVEKKQGYKMYCGDLVEYSGKLGDRYIFGTVASKDLKNFYQYPKSLNDYELKTTVFKNMVISQDGYYTYDLITWEKCNLQHGGKLVSGNGLVIFGRESTGSGEKIYISTDGINFTEHTLQYGVQFIPEVFVNGYFFAIFENSLKKSVDAINWTDANLQNVNLLPSYCNGKYYCYSNEVFYESEDATTWIASSVQYIPTLYVPTLGLYFANKYEYGSRAIVTSKDLQNWNDSLVGDYKVKLYSEGSGYIFADSYNTDYFARTRDGVNWEIVQDAGIFAYAPTKDMYITSRGLTKDFIHFTETELGGNISTDTIIYFEKIKTYFNKQSNKVYKSTDAIHREEVLSLSEDGFLICGENEVLVITGGTTYRTEDGTTWEEYENPFGDIVYLQHEINCFYLPKAKVYSLVEVISDEKTKIYWSTDGKVFTKSQEEFNVGGTFAYNTITDELIIANFSTTAKTKDGKTYTVYDLETGYNPSSTDIVLFVEELGIYMATGYHPELWISADAIHWQYNLNFGDDITSAIIGKDGEVLFVGNGIYSFVVANGENIIDRLTPDSDMTLSLEVGKNDFILSLTGGNATARIAYKQRYIGV